MKILVIEDEAALRESIEAYLKEEGSICETASDHTTAMAKVELYRYDCILLDIGLPNGSGLDILRHLKSRQYADGVLIISAKDSLDDRLTGLDLGADDYLTKPFHLSELRARVTAIVRRKAFNGSSFLNIGSLNIDLSAKEVKIKGRVIKLTPKEYALLLYFIANKSKVVSKNAIAEHLWGDSVDIADNFDFIYSHVKNLRKKIVEAGGNDPIQAAYGMGYKFTEA
ncbi:response regulator transcription factor [Mucilaginibacter daejeonensis]|uniref:response regulator transcription factor n=1 Tax=Mucilaginibacter daejeonensis TaxID=398049 RepID=UPI001D17A153|nr:response regulator transcription factor [Mucilaginibacter daejeonensis]UEG55176.1 response regulator transcription factor [Mucilaginibacter daejeonensis]